MNLHRRHLTRRSVLTSTIGAAGLLAVNACGPASSEEASSDDVITIGSKTFAESWIMGELYAQAIRALGYQVDLKSNVGSAEIIDSALRSGQVDLYPEYTGVIAITLAGHDDLLKSAESTYELAKDYEASQGVTLLKATPFENKNAIAVTEDFAAEHDLKAIGDLRGIGDFVYSTYPDNVSGAQGYDGIVETYDLDNMELKTLNIGLNYRAVEEGEIQAADVFTTDPQLLRSNLVVLEDTKNLFGFQNVVPCLRTSLLDRVGEDVPEVLNTINSLLTLEAIQTLNAASAINRLDPAQVARRFLQANDLL